DSLAGLREARGPDLGGLQGTSSTGPGSGPAERTQRPAGGDPDPSRDGSLHTHDLGPPWPGETRQTQPGLRSCGGFGRGWPRGTTPAGGTGWARASAGGWPRATKSWNWAWL